MGQRPKNHYYRLEGFPGGSVMKNLPASAGASSSVPEWGRCPGGGNGNPLRYSWHRGWTEESGGLRFMGSQRVGLSLATEHVREAERVLSRMMCWKLTLNVVVLEGEAFGSWLGFEGGVFMNGISALVKGPQRAPSPIPLCEETVREVWASTWALIWHWVVQNLVLRLSSLQNYEKYMLVVYTTYSFFPVAAWTDWETSPQKIHRWQMNIWKDASHHTHQGDTR